MSRLAETLLNLPALRGTPASQREQLRVELQKLDGLLAQGATTRPGASRSETIRRLVVDGDLDVPTGTVRIGPVAASKGNIVLASGGIKLRTNTTTKIDLQSDGDVFIGENTAAAATTNIAIFTTAQTYNSESVGAGDMLLGDNSSSKANILWDKSEGQFKFRGGTTATVTIDTDGSINMANDVAALRWYDSGGTANKARIRYTSGNNIGIVNATAGGEIGLFIVTTDGSSPQIAWDEDPLQANRTQLAVGAGVQGGKFTLSDGSSLSDVVIQTAGSSGGSAFANFPGAVNVGTTTGTTAGELQTSGAAIFGVANSTYGGITSNVINASGNTYLDSFTLNRYTSGTPAASLGLLIKTQLEDDGGTIQKALQIGASWVDATSASRKARAVFFIEDTTTREGFRIEASGSAPMIGFLGANAAARPTAYTQTYATATRTHSNITAVAPSAYAAGANGYSTGAKAQEVRNAAAALVTDVANIKQVLNQVIDDLQAYGLLA